MKKLNELISSLYEYKKTDSSNPLIKSIEMDSRLVKDGSLFICIEGYTVDGHDYAKQAVEKGAVAIISEKPLNVEVPVVIVKDTKRVMAIVANSFYDHPTKKLSLIGVTGTNGKTTTTHLIEKILNDANKKTGLIGTMYMKIANETFETKNTTPESLSLQQIFAEMVASKVDSAIMEVSSHALHLGRVRGCDFDIAVFTNLTQDHLDYHETMEAYRNAKGLLFAQLGNTYSNENRKIAVLNGDDKASKEYEKMTAAQIVTYGIDQECDVRATNIQIAAQGTTFDVDALGQKASVQLKMIGKFSVYNALAAMTACLVDGISLESIIHSLEAVEGVSGRFEPVDCGQSFTVIVDYAHTPDSLENVLNTVNEFAKGKSYVVVGCGGDRDKTKRPLMAKIASQLGDYVILTSDNPRSEKPEQIIKDMEVGLTEESNHISLIDRKEAITFAIQQAKENDVVVIAGKGHETYQIIGKETSFFDDRIVAADAIKEMLKSER
ncbi:UDP-N-acetylmuramoyl-L-alanyl-D-glutamate--2,6-diaminopimelate ligase [Anaerobacillus isosaccharinicus]|uniref:UDP-N-acetylmuramoyl-L-alanyl-D-glutamate--2,6-diaminopimelate ligase n=1 Tax=Anaerobacillus isosaccharinicus TaxID=1532552 RepID=A0A1S2M7Y6_9BACI|nr:UDP-N-acetylmuramoyl-L-alanyl-D-glutamate--2,6-diaminopimelate ligase [Anaerobacillus isosaccharinicus]MBA5587442.1 UDP-N-acetylmuramoyl-L-alanyl-D-glutamate--2,6-diaminopimelate ligase [Anaerobacillus isosaccharinicus]QOY34372.1 UDP-N-acetylmuramoyl-L-alanyl-D-glutamate--2,6-diaminopimelate ligase [Anaerobacillus isosaccharinicus]